MRKLKSGRIPLALGAVTLMGAAAFGATPALASPVAPSSAVGHVYSSTNAPSGNSVQVFNRRSDGSLSAGALVSTGGLGGTSGSQGGVTLSPDGRTLLVVNEGSNQLSDFAVGADGSLTLRNNVNTEGTDPISVAIRGNLVEVLNLTSSNVAGFYATPHGLVPIANGSQPLSTGAAGPEDVTISPNGTEVVVTEKTSNTIDTFAVTGIGALSAAVANPSTGPGAFASAFERDGQLLVADAGGAGTSAVSSYVFSSGALTPTEPALPDAQSAACWIALGAHGDAFVANAGSASIASYIVLDDGTLAFVGNTTVGATAKPLDESVSHDGRDLYVLDGANHQIDTFAVSGHGHLVQVGTGAAVAATSLGVAAS